MRLDPARWRDPQRWAVLAALWALMVLALWLAPTSTLTAIAIPVIPALTGGLIWRFDRLPWGDIASWTVPLAVWVAVAPWIVPTSLGWLVGLSVTAWLWAFIFWTRVARWWYRWLLRKPYPRS